jgi:hypothetical protein
MSGGIALQEGDIRLSEVGVKMGTLAMTHLEHADK